METKVNQKLEVTGYNPDFNSGVLKVMAAVLFIENAPEREYEIPFSEIAKAYCPDGEGEFVNVVMYYNGYDKDTGPYTEPYDFPMKPSSFVGDMLENTKDSKIDTADRAQCLLIFDNVLADILESRLSHADNG